MKLISRAEAMRRVAAERAASTAECLICGLLSGSIGQRRELVRRRRSTLLMTEYPVRWGHLMVALNEHVTSFSELDPAAFAEATDLAREAAALLEQLFRPARCYVASLGASIDRQITAAHLHLHVVPVENPDDRPCRVFTWQGGIVSAEPPEWDALEACLRAHFPS
jgi:diadenosine tetraphosphate (Ap4A) HIT family hydrolase